jgi:protoporphyrin/coproporphyrin ferrochelatase
VTAQAALPVDAVLLASFGGPEGPDEVMPFLERVTAGRGVPRERLEEVAQHYLHLGGVSPINAQNRELLTHLRAELDRRGIALPLYWGNRNSAPFFADALRQAHADGHRSLLALATSAYSSYSGCRQYRENLAAALADAGLADELTVRKARPYYARDGFRSPFAVGIATALSDAVAAGTEPTAVRVLFTTHSIPLSMAEGSGPDELRAGLPGLYERQHLDVAERAMADALASKGVPAVDWRLVFQSRSGPPTMPWLEPDIGDALREAAADGVTTVIAVPIGFVSDHVEVVWDLDNEARVIADDLGLAFHRVATPGVDPAFVSALVDVIELALLAGDAGDDSQGLCSPSCCRNPRADLPVIAGC